MIVEPRTQLGRSGTLLREHLEDLRSLGLSVTTDVDHETLETIMSGGGNADEVWLVCEAVQPKSAHGSTVYLHVPPEQVVSLLRLLKGAASAARSRAMTDNATEGRRELG